jgi:hypothetical protein
LLLNVIKALSKSEKGIFHRSNFGTDTLDKSIGFDLGSNRRQAVLQKIGKTQKIKVPQLCN